jgi:hypothetical protein
MKRIRVTVTQEDIDKAGRSSTSCPLASALRRRFPEAVVFMQVWYPHGLGDSYAELPFTARRFVREVDALQPVHPATFLLPVPE